MEEQKHHNREYEKCDAFPQNFELRDGPVIPLRSDFPELENGFKGDSPAREYHNPKRRTLDFKCPYRPRRGS